MEEVRKELDASRRAVVRAAVWAIPVVAVASAAPMAAASAEPEPPPALFSQITVDNVPFALWGLVQITGRGVGDESNVVNGALPANTIIAVKPSTGAALEIRPVNQVGVGSISGPGADGSYIVVPIAGETICSFEARLNRSGSITVEVDGDAPGGPSTGRRR